MTMNFSHRISPCRTGFRLYLVHSSAYLWSFYGAHTQQPPSFRSSDDFATDEPFQFGLLVMHLWANIAWKSAGQVRRESPESRELRGRFSQYSREFTDCPSTHKLGGIPCSKWSKVYTLKVFEGYDVKVRPWDDHEDGEMVERLCDWLCSIT